MFRALTLLSLAASAMVLQGCDEDTAPEIDICSDDLDCDDGFICEVTGEDDGICTEDL